MEHTMEALVQEFKLVSMVRTDSERKETVFTVIVGGIHIGDTDEPRRVLMEVLEALRRGDVKADNFFPPSPYMVGFYNPELEGWLRTL